MYFDADIVFKTFPLPKKVLLLMTQVQWNIFM